VTATMTWVGLDVHARSTDAAAIDRESGVLTRARGSGAEPVVAWLQELPQPVHACYEAGPTGYALYRAAEAAGLRVEVDSTVEDTRAQRPIGSRPTARTSCWCGCCWQGRCRWSPCRRRASKLPAISPARASRCGPISLVCATVSRSCCCATGASTTTAAPGRILSGWPRSTVATIEPSVGSSRRSLPSDASATQIAPAPAASAVGALPTRRVVATVPDCGADQQPPPRPRRQPPCAARAGAGASAPPPEERPCRRARARARVPARVQVPLRR
jgi:hypothetical protein